MDACQKWLSEDLVIKVVWHDFEPIREQNSLNLCSVHPKFRVQCLYSIYMYIMIRALSIQIKY